ncbi:hypothetical protein [Rhodoferax mekongensis]|uniref:Proteinase inhibitor I42 chagasin domain-containing protein n=1 Tax=Rhodoferax mekongensis TaxID=3068341 RepID=A0ABZ0AUX0_9BURK|nr:hypothetical protein [Rhodoferax sp. TBRC 17307]WNO03383.1 hypothetical protein RAN89_10630 [Rhodoferax sp. TBRC 17307]
MKHLHPLLAFFAAAVCLHAEAQTTSPPRESISVANAAVFKACATAPTGQGVCPLDAVFGIFKLAPNDNVLDFKVTNTVPLVVNQNYGWVARINQQSGKVRVLERMTLPQAPKTWGTSGHAFGTSADRKTMSMDLMLNVYNGTVSKSWDVVHGDPAGRYHITVFIDNSAPLQFEFDVVDPR